ncbi:MAG: hypothetical protein WD341_05575 [Tistlia sp.]
MADGGMADGLRARPVTGLLADSLRLYLDLRVRKEGIDRASLAAELAR